MTDSERSLDDPGTPPMKLLSLLTDACIDALVRLAYAERDRHDRAFYTKLGYGLIGAGARVLVHAYARHEQPAGDHRQVAAEAVQELRTALGLAERVASSSVSAGPAAMDIEALAEDCAQTAGRLYQLAAGLSPSAIAEIKRLDEDHDNAIDNNDHGGQPDGEPA